MRHRTRTQTYGEWLKLVKKTNPRTGRKHYSIIADPYQYLAVPGQYGLMFSKTPSDMLQAWRDHFDPAGNRGMKTGLSWKFTNKEDAERLIVMALLKWGTKYVATQSN